MSNNKITVEGLQIGFEKIGENDFISLTDLARREGTEPNDLIKSWLRNGSTLAFLETWEKLHNPQFKPEQMVGFMLETARTRNLITPQRYIAETEAVGIISKSGRYGGTWAHSDIALNFCYWLSPPFQVYLAKEFQRLKRDEATRASLTWQAEKLKDLLIDALGWAEMIGDDLKRIP